MRNVHFATSFGEFRSLRSPMDRAEIGERILSLSMAPAVASATIGDLLETGASRNSFWFWSNVFQALLTTAWRNLMEQPLSVIGLAVRGSVVQYLGSLLVLAIIRGAAWFIPALVLVPGRPAWLLLSLTLVAVAPFIAGLWIARRTSNNVFVVCVVMTMISPLIQAGINAVFLLSFYGIRNAPLWLNWWEGFFMVPYISGALIVRRHRQIVPAATD